VTKRRSPKRRHSCAAWLAIVALLIDGLLPTAVSAAATPDAPAAPWALCGAAAGDQLPGQHAPSLPQRHCALCAGLVLALLPCRQDGVAARLLADAAHLAAIAPVEAEAARPDYAAAQPRAPPRAA